MYSTRLRRHTALCLCLLALAPCLCLCQDTLKLGAWVFGGDSPLASMVNGTWVGYEADLAAELERLTGLTFELVELLTLDERITALQNKTVDLVIGAFVVTPERQELVTFIKPYYLSAGAGLFHPGGKIEGVETWEDLKGKGVAVRDGAYSNDAVAGYGAELVIVEGPEEAAALIESGEVVAFVDDSVALYKALNLTLVATPGPILMAPYGIAVNKEDTQLSERLSQAMMEMVSGGESAPILNIEEETFGAAGFPPNEDLQALVDNPSNATLLNPAE